MTIYNVDLLKGFVQHPNQTIVILAGEIGVLSEKVNAAVLGTDDCDQSDAEEEQLPWLGTFTAEETYRDLSVEEFLSPTYKSEAKAIIQEFKNKFTDLPGMTSLGSHSIKLMTSKPIFCRPSSIPFALRDTLRRDIEQIYKMGVIRKSTSPYASPVVLVKKKNGSNRICVNYRKLNRVTVNDPAPITPMETLMQELSGDCYFTRLNF